MWVGALSEDIADGRIGDRWVRGGLVKYWSNTGQILVKYWVVTGR